MEIRVALPSGCSSRRNFFRDMDGASGASPDLTDFETQVNTRARTPVASNAVAFVLRRFSDMGLR